MNNRVARCRWRQAAAWDVARLLGAAVLAGAALVGCSSSGSATNPAAQPATKPARTAVSAAKHFLAEYVDGDGRVVRRDQGGDTVSEGQGYGMLLAVAVGDRARFTAIWRWTQGHLMLKSGLFAWQWSGGQAATTSASDADLQIGWALALAGRKWHNQTWTSAARTIGNAIADTEIGYDDSGAPTLAAGPWAVHQGAPNVVEPGYWTPPAEQALADLTGDNRLKQLSGADLGHLAALTRNGATLPPDWARLGGGSKPQPIGAPDGSAPVQSGPAGMRALVWTACSTAGRALTARWWPRLRDSASAAPLSRTLTGSPRQKDLAALSAVAASSTALAAGDHAAGQQLLNRAAQIDAKYPTYYGAAWVALGRVLLTTDRLARC